MHPAAVRVLAVSACWAWFAAPARSQKVKTQKWEDFYPEQRHKSHQSSTPNEVNDKFRATSSPYQRVPVDKRKPQDLPPDIQDHMANAAKIICAKVNQDVTTLNTKSMSPWRKGLTSFLMMWKAMFSYACSQGGEEGGEWFVG